MARRRLLRATATGRHLRGRVLWRAPQAPSRTGTGLIRRSRLRARRPSGAPASSSSSAFRVAASRTTASTAYRRSRAGSPAPRPGDRRRRGLRGRAPLVRGHGRSRSRAPSGCRSSRAPAAPAGPASPRRPGHHAAALRRRGLATQHRLQHSARRRRACAPLDPPPPRADRIRALDEVGSRGAVRHGPGPSPGCHGRDAPTP